MKNRILNLIKLSNDKQNFEALENIYTLHEQLQYSTNIKQMAEDIYEWLNNNFAIDNMVFSLFDMNKNEKEEILKKGQEFFLDDEKSHFFIINTHTNLNATVSFCTNSDSHQDLISKEYETIESAFFQISPIIQNGVLKKNYIDSSSLDSVTQVFNRNFLIENLYKHLSLSKNKQDNIYFFMIGIDHFKAIIDEFDYDVGDKVLIELAKVIHSNINEFDMVARLNADEFLVTILSSLQKEDVISIADNIIEEFSKIEIIVNDFTMQSLKKTICIGLSNLNITNKEESITDSIKNADIALYEAKNKGRSVLFDFNDLKKEDTVELF